MIKNILLPAGGYGTRLKGYKNFFNCKPLIKANDGKTLLYHTLRSIKVANVAERVLILARHDTKEITKKIADSVGVKYKCILHSGLSGVRSLPLLCENELNNNPFLLICGHAPPDPKHLRKICSIRKTEYDQVITCYYFRSSGKRVKVLTDENNGTILKFIESESVEFNKVTRSYYYAESPFLLTPEIIKLIRQDKCKHWLGYHFSQLKDIGINFYGIKANFPSEADTAIEIEITLNYLQIKQK